MKVCLVNALFLPFSGGIEKHMHGLSRELVRQGVDVTIVTARVLEAPEYEEIDGAKVHRIPCYQVKVPGLYPPPMIISPSFVRELKRLDDEYGFDVIHLHNRFFIDYDMSALYARFKKKPFVMTIHNPRPAGISRSIDFFGQSYDRLIGKWPFVMADRIISVSEWSRDDIGMYGIDKEKIIPIHNGIDASEFNCSGGRDVREKYGIGDSPMLLYVGRMVAQKGLSYLVDAMPGILKRHPDVKLLMIGKGNVLDDIRARVSALGIEKSVIFPGFVPEDMLKEAYCTCDIFVLPSIVEPFGMVLVEAMACKKPVVAASVGGVPEIVDDGKSGWLVPPRDPVAIAEKVNAMLDDKCMMRHMGDRGREIVEQKFDWRLIAAKTKKVYEGVLEEKALNGKRHP